MKTGNDSPTNPRPPIIPGDTHSEVAPRNNNEANIAGAGLRDASEIPLREGFLCANCGRFNVTAVLGVYANARVGSPQRFCNPACRQSAYRRRRAGVSENTPQQLSGGRSRRLNPAKTDKLSELPSIIKPESSINGGAV